MPSRAYWCSAPWLRVAGGALAQARFPWLWRVRRRYLLCGWLALVLLVGARASGQEQMRELCVNGGFEDDRAPWDGNFVLDTAVTRSGQASARCENASDTDENGLSQTIEINQAAAFPLVISGWSKAEGVSGVVDRQFSLWCDIEYRDDTRPDRVDDSHIIPFNVGTHDWECVEGIFNPPLPIKRIKFWALFRRTHSGRVWFDDLSLRPLMAGLSQAGSAAELPSAPENDPGTAMLREQLQTAADDMALVWIRDEAGRDDFRAFLCDRPLDKVPASAGAAFFSKGPIEYPDGASPTTPEQPFVSLRPIRRWGTRTLTVEAASQTAAKIECRILLPERLDIGRLHVEEWEAQSDRVAIQSLGGRVLISLVLNVKEDTDRCTMILEESAGARRPDPERTVPPVRQLATQDGLALGLGEDGTIWTVTAGAQDVTAPEVRKRPFGVLVGDMFGGGFEPGEVTLRADGERVSATARYAAVGLRSRLSYEVASDRITVSGTIEDDTGKDRAVDVLFRLPVGGPGWRWGEDIARATDIDVGKCCSRGDVPFGCITDAAGNEGIGFALSPEMPCRFEIGFDPAESLFYLRTKYGLSPDARLKQSAPFAFSVFRVHGKWGLRDVARRYYSMYPAAFERRAMKEGAWLFAIRPSKVPNPQDYGYYEGSADLEFCEAKGILAFPYIIPGQRSITRLARLPEDYAAAMKAFDEFQERPNDSWGPSLKRMIENCRVAGPDGKYPIRIRDDMGADIKPVTPVNMVVFSTNCDPDLFGDRPDEPTVARYEFERAAKLISAHPSVDGIYIDSASAWVASQLNFRRDHFAYADFPLTYEDHSGQVAIDGCTSMVEFLAGLGAILHSSNRLVFPNVGYRPRSCWLYSVADVVGVEASPRDFTLLRHARTLAYQKPVLVLSYISLNGRETKFSEREGFEALFKRATVYGVYPSIGRYCDKTYEQFPDVYKTYMPILRRLGAAGWAPVIHATSSDAAVVIERFGPKQGELFLTVYNDREEDVTTSITVDWRSLGLENTGVVTELLSGAVLDVGEAGNLRLRPDELKVLAFTLAP